MMQGEAFRMDKIEVSEILMGPEALAAAWNLPLEDKDGRRAVRVDLKGEARFTFPPPKRDLRKYDQLVVTLATGPLTVRPTLHIELATRTPGLVHRDSFSTGRGAKVTCPGWCDYPFPWENFLIFGMGQLVYPVREMTLRLGEALAEGPVWVACLRAERRARATGPRLTDQGLAAALPGFASPADYLAHLRGRERPKHIYGSLPEAGDAWTPAPADGICRHHINGYDVGDPVDWRANPNGYLEWMHAFNRHGWMNELLRAFGATHDARYVRALDALWLSWLEANPEPVGHNGGGDPAWETLSTAVRVYGSWLNAFFALLENPDFRDSTRVEILKSFHGHAEHLLAHEGHANNWLIVESRVLFALGLLFPEFARARAWLEAGTARLEAEIGRQVYPDGADWELSTGYHMMATAGFLDAYELARMNDVPLGRLFTDRLPRAFDYIAGMTRPDGSLAAVNDSGGWRGKAGGQAYLARGAALFSRPDLQDSPEGPYAGRSRVFPDAGFHILASGRREEALWSLVDGGPAGASHCHDDALSMEFFALGLPFIVDPGITGYLRDDWTAYYRRTDSHNTVLINGAGQTASRLDHGSRTVRARGRVRCALGEDADFVRGCYEGPYEGQPEGLAHTRAVLFVRGRYWVVFDEVSGAAAERLEARFQFVPLRLALDRRRRVFRTLRQSRPNLELLVAAPGGRLALGMATGATRPVGGWVSDGEDLPAPQARIRLERPGAGQPLRLVTVVYPFARGVSSGASLDWRGDPSAGSAALAVRHADGQEDLVAYAWAGVPAAESPLILTLGGRRLGVDGDGWADR